MTTAGVYCIVAAALLDDCTVNGTISKRLASDVCILYDVIMSKITLWFTCT